MRSGIVGVRMPRDLRQSLESLASQEQRTMSEVIRELVQREAIRTLLAAPVAEVGDGQD
jgi:hypothetical protein